MGATIILLPLIFRHFLLETEFDTLCQASMAAAQLRHQLHEYAILTFAYCANDTCYTIGTKQRISIPNEQQCSQPVHFLPRRHDFSHPLFGDPCTGNHRDVDKILTEFAPFVDPNIPGEVERINTKDITRYCNAELTDHNTRDYMQYGNHSSCDAAIDKAKKAFLKDEQRGHSIVWDERMRWYIVNFHQCLVGIVDLVPSKSHGLFMMHRTTFSHGAKLLMTGQAKKWNPSYIVLEHSNGSVLGSGTYGSPILD